ncbi:hypothetical protein CLOLEP_01858 [[Clostridium] leptum DSM 753]|uniref:Uncharacterized protein n=1 Tax=[Clostridium] leptum DSM 753 TaxID=428125 RepID=A7VTG7_9FIRM|nr:hypothetical protein CLOLEP_01858 [[Clostridium] leptum DSM 753]
MVDILQKRRKNAFCSVLLLKVSGICQWMLNDIILNILEVGFKC